MSDAPKQNWKEIRKAAAAGAKQGWDENKPTGKDVTSDIGVGLAYALFTLVWWSVFLIGFATIGNVLNGGTGLIIGAAIGLFLGAIGWAVLLACGFISLIKTWKKLS